MKAVPASKPAESRVSVVAARGRAARSGMKRCKSEWSGRGRRAGACGSSTGRHRPGRAGGPASWPLLRFGKRSDKRIAVGNHYPLSRHLLPYQTTAAKKRNRHHPKDHPLHALKLEAHRHPVNPLPSRQNTRIAPNEMTRERSSTLIISGGDGERAEAGHAVFLPGFDRWQAGEDGSGAVVPDLSLSRQEGLVPDHLRRWVGLRARARADVGHHGEARCDGLPCTGRQGLCRPPPSRCSRHRFRGRRW